MEDISLSGYGFDVTDFNLSVLTPAENQLFDQLINSDNIIDAANELSYQSIYTDITIGTPCNTNKFKLFIYLPDQTVVGIIAKTIKFYTYHDANRRLTSYFKIFMHHLDSMEHPHPDNHHADVLLNVIYKLSAQINNHDKSLPNWRSYNKIF